MDIDLDDLPDLHATYLGSVAPWQILDSVEKDLGFAVEATDVWDSFAADLLAIAGPDLEGVSLRIDGAAYVLKADGATTAIPIDRHDLPLLELASALNDVLSARGSTRRYRFSRPAVTVDILCVRSDQARELRDVLAPGPIAPGRATPARWSLGGREVPVEPWDGHTAMVREPVELDGIAIPAHSVVDVDDGNITSARPAAEVICGVRLRPWGTVTPGRCAEGELAEASELEGVSLHPGDYVEVREGVVVRAGLRSARGELPRGFAIERGTAPHHEPPTPPVTRPRELRGDHAAMPDARGFFYESGVDPVLAALGDIVPRHRIAHAAAGWLRDVAALAGGLLDDVALPDRREADVRDVLETLAATLTERSPVWRLFAARRSEDRVFAVVASRDETTRLADLDLEWLWPLELAPEDPAPTLLGTTPVEFPVVDEPGGARRGRLAEDTEVAGLLLGAGTVLRWVDDELTAELGPGTRLAVCGVVFGYDSLVSSFDPPSVFGPIAEAVHLGGLDLEPSDEVEVDGGEVVGVLLASGGAHQMRDGRFV